MDTWKFFKSTIVYFEGTFFISILLLELSIKWTVTLIILPSYITENSIRSSANWVISNINIIS